MIVGSSESVESSRAERLIPTETLCLVRWIVLWKWLYPSIYYKGRLGLGQRFKVQVAEFHPFCLDRFVCFIFNLFVWFWFMHGYNALILLSISWISMVCSIVTSVCLTVFKIFILHTCVKWKWKRSENLLFLQDDRKTTSLPRQQRKSVAGPGTKPSLVNLHLSS